MTHDAPTATVKDPVCGMDVDPTSSKYASEYRGQTYAFCSLMCKKAFEDAPLRYLTKGRRADPPPPVGR